MYETITCLGMLLVIGIGIIVEKYTGVAEIAPLLILGSVLTSFYLGLNPYFIVLLALLMPGYKLLLLLTNKTYRASGGTRILMGSLIRYVAYVLVAVGVAIILAGKKLLYMGAWQSEILYVFIVFTALTATLDPRPGFFTWVGDKLRISVDSLEKWLSRTAYVLGFFLILKILSTTPYVGLLALVIYIVSLVSRHKKNYVGAGLLLAASFVLAMFFLYIPI